MFGSEFEDLFIDFELSTCIQYLKPLAMLETISAADGCMAGADSH